MPNACKYEFDKEGQCEYCGSITVALAIRYLKQPGTQFSGADWKYGFPHKYYLEPINPEADKQVVVAWKSGWDVNYNPLPSDVWECLAHRNDTCKCPREIGVTGNWQRPEYGKKPRLHFKFYNKHLADATPEELTEFSELSRKAFGITWGKDEKGIFYKAPESNSHYGYQLYGTIDANGQPDHSIMESHRI